MQKILFLGVPQEEKTLHNCIRTFIVVYNNKNVGKSDMSSKRREEIRRNQKRSKPLLMFSRYLGSGHTSVWFSTLFFNPNV